MAKTKACSKCRVVKPFTDFGHRKDSSDRRRYECKECQAAWRAANPDYFKDWKARNPEHTRRNNLRKYNLTIPEWEALFDAQGRLCAICGTDTPRNSRGWATDHDHTCCPGPRSCGTCVRGILCPFCNTGLGYVNDDPEILQAMANYLINNRHPRP